MNTPVEQLYGNSLRRLNATPRAGGNSEASALPYFATTIETLIKVSH